MAYAHGIRWTEEEIINRINEIVEKLELDHFPTKSEIREYYHNEALCNKISKTGGSEFWSIKLNLPIKSCESKIGNTFEKYCLEFLLGNGYDCEIMKPRYPYDIMVNKNIKVDVKAGYIVKSSVSPYYTFNLEKQNPTCDIFVVYCLDDEKNIVKTYVIPSKVLSGKTQLSLGLNKSIYDKYIDKWDIFNTYDEFYNSIN